MTEKVDIHLKKDRSYVCEICNTNYSSYKSLWNHNNKFHNIKSGQCLINVENVEQNVENVEQNVENNKSLICDLCNRIFNSRSAKSHHKKTCKIKLHKTDVNPSVEDEINELKKQFAAILNEKGKMHHKTLQKINKQVNNINNKHNINKNNNNINNGKIINNVFVKFGSLDYDKILTPEQQISLLGNQYKSLEHAIKIIHFNDKYPEFGNIFITNMRDNLAHIYNGDQFIAISKDEMLTELLDTHIYELNLSFEKHQKSLTSKQIKKLEDFLSMLNNDTKKYTDQSTNKTYPCYRAYKTAETQILIYNNSDKKKLNLLNNMELEEKKL